MRRFSGLFLLILFFSTAQAFADPQPGAVAFESAPPSTPFSMTPGQPAPAAQAEDKSLPDGLVQSLADYARKELPNAVMPNGKTVGPETTQEKAERFLIPFPDLQRVAKHGGISAYAYLCGLDWENRSYLPFLGAEAHSGRWTDKELVYISVMHQFTQAAFIHNLKDTPCPPDVKARLDILLPQVDDDDP
jgi:hypothetical protein